MHRLPILLTVFLIGWLSTASAEFDYMDGVSGIGVAHWHVKRTAGSLIPNPDSSTGYSWNGVKIEALEETNIIPLKKGHGFDVHLLLFDFPKDISQVILDITHPPMELPSGKMLDSRHKILPTYNERGVPEVSYSYFIDEDYELVEGKWHLSFSYENRQIFEITFTVTDDAPNN